MFPHRVCEDGLSGHTCVVMCVSGIAGTVMVWALLPELFCNQNMKSFVARAEKLLVHPGPS
jgi:hypothetical protein